MKSGSEKTSETRYSQSSDTKRFTRILILWPLCAGRAADSSSDNPSR